jgi:S1-C subfamily serine protease
MANQSKDSDNPVTKIDTSDDKAFTVSSKDGNVPRGITITLPSLDLDWKQYVPDWAKKRDNVDKFKKWGIGVLVALLLAFGFGYLGGYIENRQNGGNGVLTIANTSGQKEVVTSQSQLITQIAKNVGQSVVSVNVTGQQSTTDAFGLSTPEQTASAGTGIILSKDGLIITNQHVVPIGTNTVSVTLSNGTTLNDVTILGRTSPNDSLDIAFLKVNNLEGQTLVPAVLGDSSQVQVGDSVVAIGNALGQFQNTVTSGIISGYGRTVQASDQVGSTVENLSDLFQTDAAINEGNSGGPLVDMNGDVIGINVAIAGNAQNIGFSIPINDVKGLIEQVLSTGKFQRPYLGVYYISITPDVASQYNLSVSQGAYVAPMSVTGQQPIVSGSPADQAGLQSGDIITKVNDTAVDQNNSLTSLIDQYQVGDKITLTIIRGGKTITTQVTLAAEPQDTSSN